MTTLAEDNSNDLWGHPRGLYICFATELWERFSFYGMKYLLLLYLTKYHLFSDAAVSVYWAATPPSSTLCLSWAASLPTGLSVCAKR